jgi:hypothetical protein
MGTCNYILTQPCWHSFIEQYFVVSATNEIRGGKLEVSYVNAVHVWVYDLRISLLKDHKVVVGASLCLLDPMSPSLLSPSSILLLVCMHPYHIVIVFFSFWWDWDLSSGL